jgi:hypothetical protein
VTLISLDLLSLFRLHSHDLHTLLIFLILLGYTVERGMRVEVLHHPIV